MRCLSVVTLRSLRSPKNNRSKRGVVSKAISGEPENSCPDRLSMSMPGPARRSINSKLSHLPSFRFGAIADMNALAYLRKYSSFSRVHAPPTRARKPSRVASRNRSAIYTVSGI
jgi:hypothetical protein